MSQEIIIVDIQGFKDANNNFIIKELALATLYNSITQSYLIKPPYSFNYLTEEEKEQTRWLEKNRGIYWSEGYIDHREFKRLIVPYLIDKIIFVKGREKVNWIKELCSFCNPVDLEEKNCCNLTTLHAMYCKEKKFNCMFHKKECALGNVICLRKWCIDNMVDISECKIPLTNNNILNTNTI